jgi:hypothetical protein
MFRGLLFHSFWEDGHVLCFLGVGAEKVLVILKYKYATHVFIHNVCVYINVYKYN